MRARLLIGIVPAVILLLPGRPGAASGYEDLYRWGEYDSLVLALSPRLDADSVVARPASEGPEDRAEMARANLYVGVAWWSTERKKAGRRAFARAAALDGTLRLDPLYSTPEMVAAHADARAEESMRVRREEPPAASGQGVPARAARERKQGWLLWTSAAVVTGAAAGVYYLASAMPKTKETVIDLTPKETP